MLEVTSYGLIALGVILVLAFYLLCAEEKAALQENRPSSLVSEKKINPLRTAASAAMNRSQAESVGRKEPARLVLSLRLTAHDQACPSGLDGNGLPDERRASHG
jgi:hypothetical protein